MKTNLELAREAGGQMSRETRQWQFFDEDIDDFVTAVEARMMERLLEGTGEPVARLHVRETDTYLDCDIEVLDGATLQPKMSPIDIYTRDQIAAAVLREREVCAKVCEETGLEYDWDTGELYDSSYGCAASIRARGTI